LAREINAKEKSKVETVYLGSSKDKEDVKTRLMKIKDEGDIGKSGSMKVALVAGDFETWKFMVEIKDAWPDDFSWLFPFQVSTIQ